MHKSTTGRPVSLVYYCLLLVLLALAGPGAAGGATTVTLPQSDGTSLVLAGPVERIVTLAPNLAELVFAAGAGGKLVAVVEYSNFPPPVQQIPRIGDAFRIDLERVVATQPDLVIAWQSGNPPSALRRLEQMGLPVLRVEITRPEQIASTIENIASAAGTLEHGKATARQLQDRLDVLKRANDGKTPISYFYQVSARPLYTINGQHIISRGLEVCGLHNIFSDLTVLAPQISREALVAADPQVMIAPHIEGDPLELEPWLDWPNLQAVKNSAMLYLPADQISQATPRLLDSLELACKLLDTVRLSVQQIQE